MKKLLGLIVILCLLAAAGGWYWHHSQENAAGGFRTVALKRGDLLAQIGATGTVEPEEVIDVGAQVAGKINYFGKDPNNPGKTIDYGSVVDEGTVLAQIDDALFKADSDQTAAQVANAKADVQRAEADLNQLKAKLEQAEADWNRAQQVGTKGGLSQTDLDARRTTYLSAKASLAVGDAAIAQAKAGVALAEAQFKKSQTTLSYTTIKSPVKGVIISRRVNIGQTVVASLNAPSLFLIAKDLKRIQVWAAVNEADIGNLRPGLPATFTVDAFPGRTFKGEVSKIRLDATMTQNVVTYTVEITTDNSDGALKPYLTANVQFEIGRRTQVLTVPNSALRWTPKPEQVDPQHREALTSMPRQRNSSATTHPTSAPAHLKATLWTSEGEFVKPLRVNVGLSDGINTEVSAEGIDENTQVVIGEQRAEAASGDQPTNPFQPNFRGGRRGG